MKDAGGLMARQRKGLGAAAVAGNGSHLNLQCSIQHLPNRSRKRRQAKWLLQEYAQRRQVSLYVAFSESRHINHGDLGTVVHNRLGQIYSIPARHNQVCQ